MYYISSQARTFTRCVMWVSRRNNQLSSSASATLEMELPFEVSEASGEIVEQVNLVPHGSADNEEPISDMTRVSWITDHHQAESPSMPSQVEGDLTHFSKPTKQTEPFGMGHDNVLQLTSQEEPEYKECRPGRQTDCLETGIQQIQDEFSLPEHERAIFQAEHNRLEEINHELGRHIRMLQAENEKLKVHNDEITTSLQTAQEQAQRLPQHSGTTRPRANGNKIADAEFTSKWRQLKFNVRSLAGHVDNIPEDHKPPRISSDMQTLEKAEKGRSRRKNLRAFKKPETRRLWFETYLWTCLDEFVFDSESESDPDGVRQTFKKLRKEYLQLDIQDPAQMGSIYKWLQSGWAFTKPTDVDTDEEAIKTVNTIMRKDCVDLYKLVHGNDTRECSNNPFRLDDELRDILAMALSLDDMRMKSQAMISVVWVEDLPEFVDKRRAEYRDSHMEVVHSTGIHGENTRVKACVSPILLKTGNANGKNYESEIVLAKADVMLG